MLGCLTLGAVVAGGWVTKTYGEIERSMRYRAVNGGVKNVSRFTTATAIASRSVPGKKLTQLRVLWSNPDLTVTSWRNPPSSGK